MAPNIFNFLLGFFLLLLLIQPFVVCSKPMKPTKEIPYNHFLQNLRGTLQKGQTVDGLKEVKQYLKRFGYYPTDFVDLTDVFDDQLEFALKTYQTNYRLNVTGKLGSDTVSKMMIPRCGVPDIINPSNVTTREKQDHKSNKYFHIISDYAFFRGMPKWDPSNYDLTYQFYGLQGNNLQIMRGVCSRAFQRWADVSQFSFQEASSGKATNIVIAFYSGDHGDGQPFDGPTGILAHAFPPKDGRLHFDADENWSTNPNINQVDLESVAVHEIGHLLGLAHSDDPNAIMHSGIPPGTIKRDLTQDDIDGIHALYSN